MLLLEGIIIREIPEPVKSNEKVKTPIKVVI